MGVKSETGVDQKIDERRLTTGDRSIRERQLRGEPPCGSRPPLGMVVISDGDWMTQDPTHFLSKLQPPLGSLQAPPTVDFRCWGGEGGRMIYMHNWDFICILNHALLLN